MMHSEKPDRNILSLACIVTSLLTTYWSVNLGIDRALADKPALVWLHIAAFFVAVGLVLMGVVLNLKNKK